MTPLDSPSSSQHPESDLPRESARTIFFQFVFFPLAVVLIGVGVFYLFGIVASEDHSIREYVGTLRSGSTHRRWQAAYQLSKSLKRGEASKYPTLRQEISDIYVSAKNDDPKIRRYLSMVLGNLGDPRATPVLLDGLSDAETETRIYALWALGQLGDPRAVSRIASMTRDEDHDIRKTAAYALGEIGSPAGASALAELLKDEVADVRWNAAVALAAMNDQRALAPLKEMLDRSRTDRVGGFREDQKEEVMITAMSAYARLLGREAVPELQKIGDSDRSLRVRAVAKSFVQQLQSQRFAASP